MSHTQPQQIVGLERVDSVLTGSLALSNSAIKPLLDGSAPAKRGVRVRASSGNSTGLVYIGTSTVTAGVSAASTDGYELAAGESVEIPVSDANQLYAIGSTTGLHLSWIAF
jgi:hypothetical protein